MSQKPCSWAGRGWGRLTRVHAGRHSGVPGRCATGSRPTQRTGIASHPGTQGAADQKTCLQSTRSHAFCSRWEAKRPCRGVCTDPSGRREGCPGPLPPQAGHSRCRQKVPAKSVCDRDLVILCVHARGYDHDFWSPATAHSGRAKRAQNGIFGRSAKNMRASEPQRCGRGPPIGCAECPHARFGPGLYLVFWPFWLERPFWGHLLVIRVSQVPEQLET